MIDDIPTDILDINDNFIIYIVKVPIKATLNLIHNLCFQDNDLNFFVLKISSNSFIITNS